MTNDGNWLTRFKVAEEYGTTINVKESKVLQVTHMKAIHIHCECQSLEQLDRLPVLHSSRYTHHV